MMRDDPLDDELAPWCVAVLWIGLWMLGCALVGLPVAAVFWTVWR